MQTYSKIFILSLTLFIGTAQASSLAQFPLLPIVGGNAVAAEDPIARTTVALYFQNAEGAGGLCTGSIMDASHILTAAHCVSKVKKGIVIFKLAIDFSSDAPFQPQSVRPVTGIKKSSDYSDEGSDLAQYRDLAIITFTGGLPEGYRPVQMITSEIFSKAIKAGANAVIAGYGTTGNDGTGDGILRKTKLQVTGIQSGGYGVVVGNIGHTSCHGDSGGPSFISLNGQYYLFGVLSRGDCETVAIYTKFVKGQDVNGQNASEIASAF